MLKIKPELIPAYTISNENQRWATSVVPNVQSVLTVAGSGDQALFYKLAGATIVDTFDITPNARVIQDIKYAAIKNIKQTKYQDLLVALHYAQKILSVPQMHKLRKYLPKESRDIVERKTNINIFSCGLPAYVYPENIPTDAEYHKLKEILTEPFSFIQTDLAGLSTKISKKYDIINLSNIFDYCYSNKEQAKILTDLSKHLNLGGHIVYTPQMPRFDYKRVQMSCGNNIELAYKKTLKASDTTLILFQRTR